MDKHFFNTIRPLFRKLTEQQVDGMTRIIKYARANKVSRLHLAYVLATIRHETALWMIPIREGARRYGRDYTDAQSRRAVGAIHAKGIIRTNYALPGKYGNSFYGRSLIQLTHEGNYNKLGKELGVDLVRYPDKSLQWKFALPIAFTGMKKGLFTGKSLSMLRSRNDFKAARAIINGDVRKNGEKIAVAANTFYRALSGYAAYGTRADALPSKTNLSYNFGKGTIRSQPINSNLWADLSNAIAVVYGPEAKGVIYSGGQTSKAKGGKQGVTRTGSIRHDNGRAADLYVYIRGEKIYGLELAKLGQYWLANSYGSVGLEMRSGGIHLDNWNPPPKGGGLYWFYDYLKGKPFYKQVRQLMGYGAKGRLPALYKGTAKVTIPTARPEQAGDKTKTNSLGTLVVAFFASAWALLAYTWDYLNALF